MSLTLADVLNVTNPALLAADGVTQQNAEDFKNLMMAFLATEQFGSFPVTAWSDGSIPVALLQTDAQQLGRLCATLFQTSAPVDPATLTGSGPTNPWLDLWIQSQYFEDRVAPVQSVINVQLTAPASSQVNLLASELILGTNDATWQGTPVAQSGVDENNLPTFAPTGVSIAAGKSATVAVQALASSPGGTAVPSSDVSVISPSVAGMLATALSTGSFDEVVTGAPIESDLAYFTRAKAKWPARSMLRGNTHAAWVYWVTSSGLNVQRYAVWDADDAQNQYGGGHVVIVADVGDADLPALTSWLVNHKPINMPAANCHVEQPMPGAVAVSGDIYLPQSVIDSGAAAKALASAVTGYNQTASIGGNVYWSVITWLVVSAVKSVAPTARTEGLKLNGAFITDVAFGYNVLPALNSGGVVFHGS